MPDSVGLPMHSVVTSIWRGFSVSSLRNATCVSNQRLLGKRGCREYAAKAQLRVRVNLVTAELSSLGDEYL